MEKEGELPRAEDWGSVSRIGLLMFVRREAEATKEN